MTEPPRYTVHLRPAAKRALARLSDLTTRRRIARAIEGLAATARPHRALRVRGADGLWRIRVGDYRVIYSIEDATHTVFVATIGHRRDVYRR